MLLCDFKCLKKKTLILIDKFDVSFKILLLLKIGLLTVDLFEDTHWARAVSVLFVGRIQSFQDRSDVLDRSENTISSFFVLKVLNSRRKTKN